MQTIFISSTFQDMHQERDMIRSRVLPRIKEFAKQYGETVELCDLRWGIDDSQMDEGESTAKILQICFDEIDHSRPFFLCLLGDRYGWTPDADLVEQILHTQNRTIPDGHEKSVTELEILYGAFHHEHPERQSRFYFRTITNARPRLFAKPAVPEVYLSGNREDRQKMQKLKDKILAEYPERVRCYKASWNEEKQRLEGLEAFAETVYEDLKQMLEQRFGKLCHRSEFDKRRQQQRYAVEQDRYFDLSDPMKLSMPRQYRELLGSDRWPAGKQTLFLVSEELYSINRLAAALCPHYEELGYRIIPYDCGQSLLSGTVSGLLTDLINACGELASVDPETVATSVEDVRLRQKEQFHALMALLDQQGQKVLFLIRNLHKLEEENLLWWFPTERSERVRFVISTDRTPVGPAQFGQVTEILYFASGEIFDRATWIDLYLERYHKQVDSATKATLMELSEGKHPQYLEFLMQRLLLLDQRDFAAIKEEGGDIDAISAHLCRTLREQPEHLEDIVMAMVDRLGQEVGGSFTHGVLGLLLAAPYGLPRTVIEPILRKDDVPYSQLAMTAFGRMMGSLVNETLDGYLRCIDSPAGRILRGRLIGKVQYWSCKLEEYLAECMEESEKLQGSDRDLIRNQYLQIALEGRRLGALKRYIRTFRQEPEQTAAALHKLLGCPGAVAWVKKEIRILRPEEFLFLTQCYPAFKNNGWTDEILFEIWEAMARFAGDRNQHYPCRIGSECCFFLTYQCGEMAYLHGLDKAEDFLLEAKKRSKEDFAKYPNKLWKMAHGMALTDEEKNQDREFLDPTGSGEVDDLTLGYGTQLQDMLIEHSWSNYVRIINRYLASLYDQNGEGEKAMALEEEVARLTRLLDPNPDNRKQVELEWGVTMIMPDTQPDRKPSYSPEFRRNTAIQLAREASAMKKAGSDSEALEKYRQSNEMLLSIRKDASEPPNSEDPDFGMIALECCRDLSLNYKGMLGCVLNLGLQTDVRRYIDGMLEYALAYDGKKNSVQSKGDLEECYAVAASCCISEQTSDFEQCFDYCAGCFRYREEAAAKGEKLDQYVLNLVTNTEALFYHCLTHCPRLGNRAVDVLLEVSNRSSMYRNFEGYCRYTYLMADLLDWMWQNGHRWIGERTSLEQIYLHNITNLCSLWKQHNVINRLEQDSKRLQAQMPSILEASLKLEAAQSVSQYGLHLFGNGEYAQAAEVFGQIMQCMDAISPAECSPVFYIQHQGHYAAALSEAGMFPEAERESDENLRRIREALEAPVAQTGRGVALSESEVLLFLKKELASAYLNRAVLLSRMGEQTRAEQYLQLAQDWLQRHEDVRRAEPGMENRVRFFQRNGLPKNKKEDDGELRYKKVLEELTQLLRTGLGTLEQADAAAVKLRQLEAVPEHSVFRNVQQMACYWHELFRQYYALQHKQKAREALLCAQHYAQEDPSPCTLYAEIFSDLCAVIDDLEASIRYAGESIRIYDTLRKSGMETSDEGLAMSYYNRGLLLMRQKDLVPAKADVEQAIALLTQRMRQQQTKEAEHCLSEARRLLAYIKKQLESGL